MQSNFFNCRCLDSNGGPSVLEVTALPSESKPLQLLELLILGSVYSYCVLKVEELYTL